MKVSDRPRVEKRPDDYAERRKHLAPLSDEELKKRFWDLTSEAISPLGEIARTHTSPSIERSVLLRMGFASPDVGAIVERIVELGLLGKGAGHVILKVAQAYNLDIHSAGQALIERRYWDQIPGLFEREKKKEEVSQHESKA